MKPFSIILLACFLWMQAVAQNNDLLQLHENARTFMRQGDYNNAILVLNRCLQQDPQNLEVLKDLSLNYFYQKDNNRALDYIKPVLDRDDADDQCFQIAGNIYKALQMPRDCEKVYKKGLKKFPNSGPLFSDLGELMYAQKNYEAINQWEKGIEADPAYSRNYFNAAKYYFLTTDKVWSIIYSEIFINMEPNGNKTPEMKELLLESYKKLFSDVDLEKNNKDKNGFVKAFLQTMNKQSFLASQGIHTETLTMIRARFILEWYNSGHNKFAHRLFDVHRNMLQDGLFDAYNQWLFASVQNLAGFQNWISVHNNEYDAFSDYQRTRPFVMPPGQYYH